MASLLMHDQALCCIKLALDSVGLALRSFEAWSLRNPPNPPAKADTMTTELPKLSHLLTGAQQRLRCDKAPASEVL